MPQPCRYHTVVPIAQAKPIQEFGKYGILRESDFAAKQSEFNRWAMDVKHIDVEILPKYEEKELFKEYMEDYNTATLAHKKYYDLEAYERHKAAKAAKKGARTRVSAPLFDVPCNILNVVLVGGNTIRSTIRHSHPQGLAYARC